MEHLAVLVEMQRSIPYKVINVNSSWRVVVIGRKYFSIQFCKVRHSPLRAQISISACSGFNGLSRADEVHAGLGKPAEEPLSLRSVIDHARHNYR